MDIRLLGIPILRLMIIGWVCKEMYPNHHLKDTFPVVMSHLKRLFILKEILMLFPSVKGTSIFSNPIHLSMTQ
nr:hypothetical protein Iba_scaffold43298CG0680 [Ipomoea batatas]GMD89308.1 hypothetical protein Iba_chr14cCG15540 [Ipomoea batatas]